MSGARRSIATSDTRVSASETLPKSGEGIVTLAVYPSNGDHSSLEPQLPLDADRLDERAVVTDN